MPENLYIAIEGPIGVGKSTLARLIQPDLDARLLMEVFEENPFLSSFYADREQYAFQTQLFFLLSRYRQQSVAPNLLAQGNAISDYTFAKDRLFAHLNVHGDELALYDHLHDLLAEKILDPDLIVYLRADTDVLMERIAVRDREYERNMDRGYIEALSHAYEQFFADYHVAPVITIDTNNLNIIRHPEDLSHVMARIKSVLGRGTHQRPLPEVGSETSRERIEAIFERDERRLPDLQHWHHVLDREKGFTTDLARNFICLQEEIGELATEVLGVLGRQRALQRDGMASQQALETAVAEQETGLCSELADCLAYLLKLANYTGIDLESAYLAKMRANWDRTWRTALGSTGVADETGEAGP